MHDLVVFKCGFDLEEATVDQKVIRLVKFSIDSFIGAWVVVSIGIWGHRLPASGSATSSSAGVWAVCCGPTCGCFRGRLLLCLWHLGCDAWYKDGCCYS